MHTESITIYNIVSEIHRWALKYLYIILWLDFFMNILKTLHSHLILFLYHDKDSLFRDIIWSSIKITHIIKEQNCGII